MKFAFITWVDATYQDGELALHDFSNPVTCVTCGWLVQDLSTHVSVSLEYHPASLEWRRITHIPKVLIKSMEVQEREIKIVED